MHSWRQTKNLVRNQKHGEIQIKQKECKYADTKFYTEGEISIKKIDELMGKSKKSSMQSQITHAGTHMPSKE